VRYLYSRWGRLKISQALRLKRVDREYIDEALDEEIDQQVYEANLLALLRAKLRQLPDSDDEYAICGKLMRFAAGRGFEPSLIMRVVESGALGDDSDVAPTD
ncbi:MAG: RecX family transcriptional regulator, partial [Muribaculaceae bacterium]|nr:RecX family transcriptional regulator [Muribaculaceae bacterium]